MVEIQKSQREVLRISRRKYKETTFMDIRTFTAGVGTKEGKWIPSRKGVTFPESKVDEICKALMEQKDATPEEGMGDS
jgi:hypothetical protein